ncbi:MAG TPA: serine/threonine-protein kinase [Polyangiaceae bacterium]|nr:serine/threonine-protein kinase [Polyangiaceae bacterium]
MGLEVDLPPVLGGRYRPLRPLGVGGMGAVYVVEHIHTGERLALKVLLTRARASDDAIERFKREARALALVRSEHVVRVTDADVAPELDGAPFMVMELLEGTDLERATRGKPQSPPVVIEWLRQVGRGLERAHSADITHRDLKPENLFLAKRDDGSDLIKILDFGIAKVRADGAGGRTQTGQIVGTPKFMSPEQARGETAAVGPAADIWALGLIAFRLLTGTDYWTATAVTLLLAQIIYEPIVPPSARGCTLGPAFDQWFLRSCEREPGKRFASVREQIDALADALSGREVQTLPPAAQPVTGVTPSPERPSDATPAPPQAPTDHSSSALSSTPSPARRPRRLAALLGLGAAAAGLVGAGVAIGAKASRPPSAGVALVENVVAGAPAATPSASSAATSSAAPPLPPTATASSPTIVPVPPPADAEPEPPPQARPPARPPQGTGARRTPAPAKPPPGPAAPTPPAPAPAPPAPRRDPLEDQH